jgi:Matrixin
MKTVIFLVITGLAVYWFGFRPGCGAAGALACPDPAIEQGVGVVLNAKEVCRGVGYFCGRPIPFQVIRWPLDKGKLRVRVQLPDFVQGEDARQIQAAAIEGIMQWNNHPFPLLIQTGTTFRWDVGVVWSQGIHNGSAGVANPRWEFNGKRVSYSVEGIGVVVPPKGSMPSAALLARVRDVASHEMGHALGIMWHSERESDIMFPTLNNAPAGPSERDFLTLDALYELPNGAMVQ